jgi:hypothetical protein
MKTENKDRWTYRIDYGMSWRDCPFTVYYCNGVRSFSTLGECRTTAHDRCIALECGKEEPPKESSSF